MSRIFAVSFALLMSNIARAEIRYTVTDLGDLGQHYAKPYAVSNRGDVVGQSFNALGQSRGFLWSAASGMIDLVPPGADGAFPTGVAYGVNDLGQAVGYHSTDHNQPFLPFIYDKSSGLRDIGSLGGGHGIARAVNNASQVVGDSITSEGADHAFLWSASSGMQDITPAAGFSQAEAINNHGEVAGWMETPGHDFAFIWRPTTGLAALGTLGGKNSYGYGINNSGEVVGEAQTSYGDGNQRSDAFLWSATSGMIDLGTFGGSSSVAYGINDSGWVVGNAYDSDEILQPFVYDGISMRNLNDLIDPSSGWRLSLAQGINNLGQIVVSGTRSNQPWGHGLLLTPAPEPSAWWISIGASVLIRTSRNRTRGSAGAHQH